jgi:protein gp37
MQAELKRCGMPAFSPVVCPELFYDLELRLARARKPRRVFIGSMGDIGGGWDYTVVSAEPSGGRAGIGPKVRTGKTLSAGYVRGEVADIACDNMVHQFLMLTKNPSGLAHTEWSENVWIGVSAATSGEAAARVPLLRHISTGFYWASIEPLLDDEFKPETLVIEDGEPVDWVVVGGLSGGNNPQKTSAAKRIVSWCAEYSVPCFVKENMRRAEPGYGWPTELPIKD